MIGLNGQVIKHEDEDDPYGISSSKYGNQPSQSQSSTKPTTLRGNLGNEQFVEEDLHNDDKEPEFYDDNDQDAMDEENINDMDEQNNTQNSKQNSGGAPRYGFNEFKESNTGRNRFEATGNRRENQSHFDSSNNEDYRRSRLI